MVKSSRGHVALNYATKDGFLKQRKSDDVVIGIWTDDFQTLRMDVLFWWNPAQHFKKLFKR